MTKLNGTAKATLREVGISQAAWARANYMPDGVWRGDQCGCPDADRCANGFHHMGQDDCGCLPALIEQYFAWLRGEVSHSFDETAYEYVNRVVVEDRRVPAPEPPQIGNDEFAAMLSDYAGLVVALSGTKVIASGLDLADLQSVLRDKGLTADIVMRVPNSKQQED